MSVFCFHSVKNPVKRILPKYYRFHEIRNLADVSFSRAERKIRPISNVLKVDKCFM